MVLIERFPGVAAGMEHFIVEVAPGNYSEIVYNHILDRWDIILNHLGTEVISQNSACNLYEIGIHIEDLVAFLSTVL